MDALRGLSALAAEMPPIQIDGDEQARWTLSGVAPAIVGEAAKAEARRTSVASSPLQKRHVDVVDGIDEAGLVRMELARRATLSLRPHLCEGTATSRNNGRSDRTIAPTASRTHVDDRSLLADIQGAVGISSQRDAPFVLPGLSDLRPTSRAVRLGVGPGHALSLFGAPPTDVLARACANEAVARAVRVDASQVRVLHQDASLFAQRRHQQQQQQRAIAPSRVHVDGRCLLNGLQLAVGSSAHHPPSNAVQPGVGLGYVSLLGATPSVDVLARARANEVGARASWADAAQDRILHEDTSLSAEQQQRAFAQEMLYQNGLYQDKHYQDQLNHRHLDKLYQDKIYQENLACLQRSATMAAGLPRFLPAMSGGVSTAPVEDVMADLAKFSKLNRGSDSLGGIKSTICAESSPLELKHSQSISVQEQERKVKEVTDQRYKTLSLYTDPMFLTEAQCFIRSTCLEIFVSTEEDFRAPGRGARPHHAGQVGFRCIYCRHAPPADQANQAVCYPSKRDNIFDSIRNYERLHLQACPHAPEHIKRQYDAILQRDNGPKRPQKLVRAYYAQAAGEVGLVDAQHGLRFRKDGASLIGGVTTRGLPYSEEMRDFLRAALDEEEDTLASKNSATLPLPPTTTLPSGVTSKRGLCVSDGAPVNQNVKGGKFDGVASDRTRKVLEDARKDATPLVRPGDFQDVSDYIFLLFHQLLPCKPTAAAIKRRRLRLDQLRPRCGLRCKHCRHEDGSHGMYLPLTADSLGDSSFSQTLMMHLSTCQFIDEDTKHALNELKRLGKEYNISARRGAKKKFVEKIWMRMGDVLLIGEGVAMRDEQKE